MNQIIDHKNSTRKLLEKERNQFQIQHAFNFLVWNQLYLGTKDFNKKFNELKKIYQKDRKFQKYIEEDCAKFHKEMKEHQVNFFLEEILLMYLITHGEIELQNSYVENQEKWILVCYPGKFLKSEIYLYQLNPFNLKWPENPYQKAFYDLKAKQLIEYNRVDLETYSVK